MELFSLRKIRGICPRGYGPGPLVLAHGSMDFIKCRSLATRSTARIKPVESVSQLLIMYCSYISWPTVMRELKVPPAGRSMAMHVRVRSSKPSIRGNDPPSARVSSQQYSTHQKATLDCSFPGDACLLYFTPCWMSLFHYFR
jgi:hypothetical protein